MKYSTLAASLLTAGTLAFSSIAAAITVDGVTWNAGSIFDFSSQNSIFEKPAFIIGDELTGIGQIEKINSVSSFCASCELTFEFGGYTLRDNNFDTGSGEYDPDGPGGISASAYGISAPSLSHFGEFKFTGGWLKVYVDNTPDFDALNKATATDGTLWLSLLAVDSSQSNAGTTLAGSLTTLFTNGLAGEGTGLFNVVGGSAGSYLNTNGQTGGTDLSYSSSFQPLKGGASTPDGYTHFGTSEVFGDSKDIPEPSAVALFGLGLLGLGFARNRKQKA